MHSSLLVSHIEKLVHVVRTSNVSTKIMRRNNVRLVTFMEHDFRLTAGTLTKLSSRKQTSGNIAIGTVDDEQASGNVAVGGSNNYPKSTSVRSIRIVPSRSGDGQAHLDHSSLLTISSHLLSKQIINQHIGLGSPNNIFSARALCSYRLT